MELKGLLARFSCVVSIALLLIISITTALTKLVSGAIVTWHDVWFTGVTCHWFGTWGHEKPSYIMVDDHLGRRHTTVRGVGLHQNRTSAAVAGTQDGYRHHHHHHHC